MYLRLNFVILLFMALFYLHTVVSINTVNGRYTQSIKNFKLMVPHKITTEGFFSTFEIPHYFEHKFDKPRSKRSSDDPEVVHYGLHLNDKKYHVDLWPNHGFLAPNLVFEKHTPNVRVQDRELRNLDQNHFCHYTGQVRGYPNSKAALTTCNGLAGYVTIENTKYFVEPVEEHEPNEKGQHLHVVYEKPPDNNEPLQSRCGTMNNWEEAWKKRFREQLMENEQQEKKDKERSLRSDHRYLETLVVCDKKFLQHHKNTDYELYVLTVMNMVADFYHDSSSGNQMDVVVVRIMYLEKEEQEIDLVINRDAPNTLASFCKWQEKINPKDIENPNHHDIAVLLTRHDICADKTENCGLMGLAYVATACTTSEPCAINEDSGLVLGTVVAHEMGHVMGCAHDKEDNSPCPAQDTDESFFIMAPYVHLFTIKWSTCSRGYITALFENNLGECLNDEPQISLYKYKNALPGTVYDAQTQCNMDFPDSTPCIINDVNFCEQLLCRTADGMCMTKEEPPADGTSCGQNKWCFRKQCVEIGERPEAINGGWGSWGAWSACSRTCGAGVSLSSRECDNPKPQHKGRYCIGDRKKIKTCNMKPCPEGSTSFRDVQCSDHDKVPFNDKLYHWRSFLKEDEPCVLYCLNDENVFSKIEPRVKDGTNCKRGTRDMCISGVCKKIGCDGEVDSTAVEDICGVCNGDGTQCKITDETYTDVGARDYKKIATIPSGSRNILIEELGSSMNTIAVADKTEKHFYLNGDNTEAVDGPVKFGKSEGLYSHPEPGKEVLKIPGPLDDDIIFFVVFYRMENPGYRYKFAVMTPDLNYTPHYQWELLEWGECSAKCGGGVQTAEFQCVEDKAGKVSNNFCSGIDKPNDQPKKCNEKPCKTKWKVSKWSKCHACKFKSGVKMREVECVRESPRAGTEDVLVEDKLCTGAKPGSRQLCNSLNKCKKTGRSPDGLSDDLMAEVWQQTNQNTINKRKFGSAVEEESEERKPFGLGDTGLDESPTNILDLNKSDIDNEICTRTESEPEATIKSEEKPETTVQAPESCEPNDKACAEASGNLTSQSETESSTHMKVHLSVGKIVLDRVPSEEIKLMRVPLKPSHISENLTDIEFEELGDAVGDRIDTGKAQEITGEKAAQLLKQYQEMGTKNSEEENGSKEEPVTKKSKKDNI